MKPFFKNILSPDEWLIHEKGFDASIMQERESLFTLGNGYMGSRGVLEEIPFDTAQGTYIAGVFDKSISQVSEIVNAPNPVDLRIIAEGEKIDIRGMYLHEHNRILDMKNGLLARHTVLANSRKERFDYKSLRFISSDHRQLGAMRIWITLLDAPIILTIQDNINTSVRNKGVLTEGRKKHFQVSEVRSEKSINYVCAKTQDTSILLACATHLTVSHSNREYSAPDQSFDIRLKKGETLVLTKVFYGRTSRHLSRRLLRDRTIKSVRKYSKLGFDRLLSRQKKTFSKLWQFSDIKFSGDRDAQKTLRFNIYHMLIAGNSYDNDISIGARALTGEGYRGHVFWDTEIFLLPFYIYAFPKIAKNLLIYRYNRLDAARGIAKKKKFKGALFPWESADTGEDETPQWHKDLDGTIVEISTQDYEHHIVADIAYGLWHYYIVTGDKNFMNQYGAEMLFETARFWASRVKKNKQDKRFEIHSVMGPDEFHPDVNNNAYTNGMAQWNLKVAAELCSDFIKKHPARFKVISAKIGLKPNECKQWANISDKLYIPVSKRNKVIEEFEGYFKKKDVAIRTFDKYFMPEFPPNLPLSKVGQTQLVKQLDACMLLYLLSDKFDSETLESTHAYYEKRTVHKSSLSPSINAIINLRTGNAMRAYQYFLCGLGADLKMNQSNVSEGIHVASLGGSWQAVVNGFGGMRVKDEYLSFKPQLPEYWRDLEFCLNWRGKQLNIRITHKYIRINVKALKNKRPLKVEIFDDLYTIIPGRSIVVPKKDKKC